LDDVKMYWEKSKRRERTY